MLGGLIEILKMDFFRMLETCKECFLVQDIDGKGVSLNKFKGKVLLIVNVASRWYSNYITLVTLDSRYLALNYAIEFLEEFICQ